MASESKTAVVAAIVGNLAIAVSKFVVAAITGSSALLSEAIHSLVDTGNGGLILYGIRRSRRPPDAEHPFGHGRELYFWTLIVGILVFALGGGISLYEGVSRIAHPGKTVTSGWSYVVLGASAVFEGIGWYFGWKAIRAEMRGRNIVEVIHDTKDPTNFAVVLEDSAALLGIVVAFLGLFLADGLGMPALDGVASIVIGLLLCGVALVMVYESKGLLVGEGAAPSTLAGIREMASDDPSVERVTRLLSLYLGPEEVLLTIDIRFHSTCTAADIRHAVARLKGMIQAKYPRIRHIFFDAASIGEP